MKLYYSPGACSLSPHIALREAGIAFDLEQVDLATKKTKAGADFTAINPKGQVPVLVLDNGQQLTENPAVSQYIADQKPGSGLAPAAGTWERYRLEEWLSFVGSELHKNFAPLFRAEVPDEYKRMAREALGNKFAYVDHHLSKGGPYLMGNHFTVADAYCFVVVSWSHYVKIDLKPYPKLQAYLAQVTARPKVHEAMKAEGLLK